MKQLELTSLKNQQLEELLSLAKAASQQADPSLDNFKAKAESLYRLNNQLKDQLSIKTRQSEDAENKCRKLVKEVSKKRCPKLLIS